ncbi:MAG: radical SAM protein [Deltaproteobacteria bacterium]|nr:radical SAM protein [Deltaproteobacteria bacterium]
MKAVLAQLPVPSFLWPHLDANLPLAAGYLAAWAKGQAPDWDVEILPWQEADILGDEALLRAVLARRPDVAGLTAYLWNAERTVWLADRLSEAGVTVLLGGPEVLPDNAWLWEKGRFAAGVPGEGEAPFAHALDAVGGRRSLEEVPGLVLPPNGRSTGRGLPPLDLSSLPSPYLSGVLDPSSDGAVWLETVRGCAFQCTYCRYGKQYGRPQAFPDGWLERHLEWALAKGAREVYLMDPSFNVRSDWGSVLDRLERGNPDRSLAFHTELVADALIPGDARRLARAGLRSCEVGLQSVRAAPLAAVGRRWDRERWLRGVRELLDEGISVTVGVIVGLPGDGPEGFGETLDFVLESVPGAQIQVFPLALLPGTDLREEASSRRLEHLTRPPYTVTRTPGYPPGTLSAAFDRFEEVTGLELDPLSEPPVAGPWEVGGGSGTYVSGVRLDVRKGLAHDWVEQVVPRAARNLTVWVRGWRDSLVTELGDVVRRLPHGVMTLVLEGDPGWPVDRLSRLLSEVGTGDHYLDRYYRQLYGEGARVVPRLVAVVADGHPAATRLWVDDISQKADVVWSVEGRSGWEHRVSRRARRAEWVLVEGEVREERVRALLAELGDDAAWVLFGCADAERCRGQASRSGGVRAPERRLCLP